MENTTDNLNPQAGGPPPDTAQDPALVIQVPVNPSQEEENVEYEYVYEDEDGNPIETPEENFNPDHYEEKLVGVIDENGVLSAESAESQAPEEYDEEYEYEHEPVQEAEEEIVETDSVAPETAKAETVTLPPRSRSSRRNRNGRASGHPSSRASSGSSRQRPSTSRRSNAIKLKHAKIKTYLMLGSVIAIPVLIISIIAVCYNKGYWPFSPKTVTRHVENDYQAGDSIGQQAKSKFYSAFRKYRDGSLKEDAYYKILKSCEASLETSIRLLMKSREQNPGEGFYYIDQKIQDANLKARTVREEIFIIDSRNLRKNH